jgi:YfiR/HmsC-like
MSPRRRVPLQKLRLTRYSEQTRPQSVPRMKIARHRFLLCVRAIVHAFRITVSSLVFVLPAWSLDQAATPGTLTVAAISPSGDLADFIVNIARYTSWPKAATPNSLTICYAHGGALPMAAITADQVPSVKGIPVVWQAINAPRQTVGCNIVWLNSDVRPAPREWLNAVNDQPILTLSNYADFTADGGIIGAYRVGSDWRFEINLEALQRSRVNIAAVALRLSQKQRLTAGSGVGR